MIKFPLSVVIAAVDKWTGPLAKMQSKVQKTFAPLHLLGTKLHALGEASGVRRLGEAFAGVGQAVGRVISTVARFAAVIGGALVAAAAGLYSLVLATAKAGDEAGETARKIGIEVEALQELQYGAKLSGLENAALASSLVKLSRNMGLAAMGSRSAAAGFRRLGVSVLDGNGKLRKVEDVLADVADGLNNLEDPLKRNAIGAMIFGKSSAELNTLLAGGSKGLRAYALEARKLGVVLSKDAVAASDKFMDAQDRTKSALVGVRNTIGVALLPALTELADKLTVFLTEHRAEIAAWAERFAKGLPERIEKLRVGFVRIREDLRPLVRAIGGLVKRFGAVKVAVAAFSGVLLVSLVPAILATISALAMLSTALVSTPAGWVLIVLAAAAIAGGVFAYTLIKIAENWDALVALIRVNFAVFKAYVRAWVSDVVDSIMEPFKRLFAWLENKFAGLQDYVPDWLKNLADKLFPVTLAASGAPAAGAISAAGAGVARGGTAKVEVEFLNAPKGTRVSNASNAGPEVDLSLGYSLTGGN